MIKSMTGFGRGEYADEKRRFTVELKTVNHRYLDVSIRMPRKLNCFENAIRALLKTFVERGKTDLYITCEEYGDAGVSLRYNAALAAEYMDCFRRMKEQFGLENDIRVSTLARFPEVLTMEESETDEQELWSGLSAALSDACSQLAQARAAEGERLALDLSDKLSELSADVSFIQTRSPQIMEEYQKRLTEKVQEMLDGVPMDESRIAAEVTIYADKVCVDEETVRLLSHIRSMQETLAAGGAVGRRLDFIAQEMNREANTILSKANNSELSDVGIRLKTGIEKIREQVQNIE